MICLICCNLKTVLVGNSYPELGIMYVIWKQIMFWVNNFFPTKIVIHYGGFFQNHVSRIQNFGFFYCYTCLWPVKICLILQHMLPFNSYSGGSCQCLDNVQTSRFVFCCCCFAPPPPQPTSLFFPVSGCPFSHDPNILLYLQYFVWMRMTEIIYSILTEYFMHFFYSLLKIPYGATWIKIFALPLLSLFGPSWLVCDW